MPVYENLRKFQDSDDGAGFEISRCDSCRELKMCFFYGNPQGSLDLCKKCMAQLLEEFPNDNRKTVQETSPNPNPH